MKKKINGVSNMSSIDGDFKPCMQASEFCGCLVLADCGDLADSQKAPNRFVLLELTGSNANSVLSVWRIMLFQPDLCESPIFVGESLNLPMSFFFKIVQHFTKSTCIHMLVGELIESSDFYW